ncbi:HesB/YadR/YfhF-family protein [Paenibacillus curdlanolyticus YK9]|uniref:HesB/YadR/YfhF-family protein n=1 Tax=Paenibacillus curdlanolyticus YK9 TaxID=717606 RepID=E0I608_9BACL|nr:HesB/YadR/YfhF-family protein [Paenibacillus curdlanolyticus]EFM12400.1 HesB/YadR/YfhF-family protein [Paenibacillus curdlanolyticus YK9]
MKINVEPAVAQWYIDEMGLKQGDQLHIFVRLGGCGSVQPGMSLGITKEPSQAPRLKHVSEGIEFYMLEDQLWYLDNKSLSLQYNEKEEGVGFYVS